MVVLRCPTKGLSRPRTILPAAVPVVLSFEGRSQAGRHILIDKISNFLHV